MVVDAPPFSRRGYCQAGYMPLSQASSGEPGTTLGERERDDAQSLPSRSPPFAVRPCLHKICYVIHQETEICVTEIVETGEREESHVSTAPRVPPHAQGKEIERRSDRVGCHVATSPACCLPIFTNKMCAHVHAFSFCLLPVFFLSVPAAAAAVLFCL